MKPTTEQELRELDAWIAEHVMDMDVSSMFTQSDGIYSLVGPVPGNRHLVKFSPTANPAAALEVWEKCLEKTEQEECCYMGKVGGEFLVGHHDLKIEISAGTLPLAICLFSKELFSQ